MQPLYQVRVVRSERLTVEAFPPTKATLMALPWRAMKLRPRAVAVLPSSWVGGVAAPVPGP